MRLKKRLLQWVSILVVAMVIFQVGRQFLMEEEWTARNYLYDRVKTAFPVANQKVEQQYGIRPKAWPWAGKTDLVARLSSPLPKPVVILIHGLDEPGRIWFNLAPVLYENGYEVLFMSYPNDQEITASARLFARSLKKLDIHPDNTLVVIAHSMGGLVTREMLTSPDIRYAQGLAQGVVPPISGLIMVGTPNGGSHLARFRFVMEVRDQVQNLFEENAHWLQGLLDGTGAAGLDLIPGSDFLTRLNSRPHPNGVGYHIIAGVLSPWSGIGIREESLRPSTGKDRAGAYENALEVLANVIGDGLVPLDSAEMDPVPSIRVKGNHLTMIRNLTRDSSRVPPAIPVILDILAAY